MAVISMKKTLQHIAWHEIQLNNYQCRSCD